MRMRSRKRLLRHPTGNRGMRDHCLKEAIRSTARFGMDACALGCEWEVFVWEFTNGRHLGALTCRIRKVSLWCTTWVLH